VSVRDKKVLVVDDEPPARMRLAKMVEAFAGYELCATADNGDMALELAASHQPDIVLMDIRMPGKDGLQAAKQLADNPNPPALIFCTAYDEHALVAFEANAVEYLLKPIRKEQLLRALEKAQSVNRAQMLMLGDTDDAGPATLLVKIRGSEELIDVSEIRAMVADQKYVSAYLPDREFLLDESLKSLEDKYPNIFLRVHRNALVNSKYIEALESEVDQYQLRLRDVDVRPVVSRRLLPIVRRTMREA